MKEADIFENWINNLAEGTWTLPETPEQLDKLKTLMTKELIVGPDATNATEQLYDLVGDDILFDRLIELADRDPRANAWNDTEVMNRIRELGIEMPEPAAPGNPAEPQTGATAPVAANVAPNPAPVPPVAEALNAMRRAAGLAESAMLDESGNTWDHLLDRFRHEVDQFKDGNELDHDLYDALFDYYSQHGAMPYGVAKGRTGDPFNWVSERLSKDLGLDEGVLGTLGGAAIGAVTGGPLGALVGGAAGQDLTKGGSSIIEGSCNMTMEGEYCPEHGLAECGGMYEMGTVAGGMAPVIGEGETVYRDGLYRDDSYAHMGPERALEFTQGDTSSGVLSYINMMQSTAQEGRDVSYYLQALQKLENAVVNGGDPRVQKPYKFIMDKANAGALKDPKMAMQVMDQAKNMMGYGNTAQESKDDPMNYNAAITGSYYESKEGDATLARIKSLALLK